MDPGQLASVIKAKKKDAEIVIYCGCCPFDRCPNVRPAILDLPHNIKTDWIDKGYPTDD